MSNKMKFWRRTAASIKTVMVAKGWHETGKRYGRLARVVPAAPVWRGGPPSMCAPSQLLSGLLKRQASL